MTAPRPQSEILTERLEISLALSEANAAHHRALATAGGTEIELMLHDRNDGPDDDAACAAARSRGEAARAHLAETQRTISALEERLAEVDRELALADAKEAEKC